MSRISEAVKKIKHKINKTAKPMMDIGNKFIREIENTTEQLITDGKTEEEYLCLEIKLLLLITTLSALGFMFKTKEETEKITPEYEETTKRATNFSENPTRAEITGLIYDMLELVKKHKMLPTQLITHMYAALTARQCGDILSKPYKRGSHP